MDAIKIIFSMSLLAMCLFTSRAIAVTPVVMNNLSLQPQTITIDQCDSVEWHNTDNSQYGGVLHTTTSGTNCTYDGTGWDSGVLFLGWTYKVTFNTPGSYPYFDRYHCPSVEMAGTVIVNPVLMPLPVGPQRISYIPVSFPVINADPLKSMPVGIGDFAAGGPTVTVQIQTAPFGGPVNVFFAVGHAGTIRILTPTGFQNYASAGLVPWMTGVTGCLNVAPFGSIRVADLPKGLYTLYLGVSPAVTPSWLIPYYLWQTTAVVP